MRCMREGKGGGANIQVSTTEEEESVCLYYSQLDQNRTQLTPPPSESIQNAWWNNELRYKTITPGADSQTHHTTHGHSIFSGSSHKNIPAAFPEPPVFPLGHNKLLLKVHHKHPPQKMRQTEERESQLCLRQQSVSLLLLSVLSLGPPCGLLHHSLSSHSRVLLKMSSSQPMALTQVRARVKLHLFLAHQRFLRRVWLLDWTARQRALLEES